MNYPAASCEVSSIPKEEDFLESFANPEASFGDRDYNRMYAPVSSL
jgi:hypothetical protein